MRVNTSSRREEVQGAIQYIKKKGNRETCKRPKGEEEKRLSTRPKGKRKTQTLLRRDVNHAGRSRDEALINKGRDNLEVNLSSASRISDRRKERGKTLHDRKKKRRSAVRHESPPGGKIECSTPTA